MNNNLAELINFTHDFSFGSLWWVKDTLWKILKKDFHLSKKKKYHPALCLGGKKVTSIYQTVPMLFGSHSNNSGFPLDGLTSKEDKKDKERYGYFPLRCYNIAVNNMFGKEPGLSRNSFKSKLNETEMNELKKYLVKKGISFNE